jgi:hypothetical protein
MQTNRRAWVWITSAAMVLATTMSATASQEWAASQERAGETREQGRPAIVGSWAETVTPRGGLPFSVLQTYGGDGMWISSAQGNVTTGPPFPAAFTAGHGQWIHREGRTFSATAISIGSSVTNGQLLVIFKIRQTVTLNRSGDAYRGVIRVEASDPGGNLLFAFDGTNEARRIDVEPLD